MSEKKSEFIIDPPLLNSSCPWATTREDLRALYDSPYTGAVTTRTSLLGGFAHDPSIHQHVFFTAGSTASPPNISANSTTDTNHSSTNLNSDTDQSNLGTSSLNTYGYSPLPLSEYLNMITEILTDHQTHQPSTPTKPFVISVTGTPNEIAKCYTSIAALAQSLSSTSPTTSPPRLAMEINLSCPNIHNAPPPAYTESSLMTYLEAVRDARSTLRSTSSPQPPQNETTFVLPFIGLKLPPYTYTDQFTTVSRCLVAINSSTTTTSSSFSSAEEDQTITFLTSTNTLGSSLVLSPTPLSTSLTSTPQSHYHPTLTSSSGTGHGGLAGSALHPISLGNVSTLRTLLDQHPSTSSIFIIGVGGVSDADGYERMSSVGAGAVGVATGLGRVGVRVFERIATGEERGMI